jgi:hypothetical protein
MKGKLGLVSGIIFAVLLTGCVTIFVPVDTPTPPPTAIIIQPTAPPPTETLVPTPTAIQLAPLCSVDPLAIACSAPKAATLSKSCIKKVPYTLMALSPGSSFETTEAGITCRDEGLRGGQQQISCTGQELISYELKVCNTTCSIAGLLETNSNKCPDGYGFSSEAGCCWPTSAEVGCTTYKVDIGACP